MMHYAHVVLEAKDLGFSEPEAREFARKVVTTAAILAMMPEEVLCNWRDRTQRENPKNPISSTMKRLGAAVPVLQK